MPKTTEIQIEKSRNLIEGLRRHVREMGEEVSRTTRLMSYYPQERWPDYGIPDKR